MSDNIEKKLKTFQRTSRMKFICSKDGVVLFQSNDEDEFAEMRQEYLKSIAKTETSENSSPL